MDAGLFENYEQDYTQVSSSISRKLTNEIPTAKGGQRKTLIDQVSKEIKEAEEIISKMEMELSGFPAPLKSKMQPRLRNYQSDIEGLKKNLKNLMSASQRNELLQGGNNDDEELDATSYDQRQRLLKGTERMQATSNQLDNVINIANETEEIGANIMNNLRGQREQIENTQRRMREADSNLDRSTRILRGMARRIATNKVITAMIILVLLIAIGAVVYSKFSG